MENLERKRERARQWRLNNPEKYEELKRRQREKRGMRSEQWDKEAQKRTEVKLKLTPIDERHRQARSLGEIWLKFIAGFSERLTGAKREEFFNAPSVYVTSKKQSIGNDAHAMQLTRNIARDVKHMSEKRRRKRN